VFFFQLEKKNNQVYIYINYSDGYLKNIKIQIIKDSMYLLKAVSDKT